MIKNVIFDWSGTLNNDVDSYVDIVNEVFRMMKYDKVMTKEEIRREFTIPYMIFWNKYFPDLTKEDQDDMFRKVIHLKRCELYPGVKEFLFELKEKGIKIFVVSSDLKRTLIPEATKDGVKDIFVEIFAHVYLKGPKIKEVVENYNLNPEETLYVGDTSGDIDAGKEAGVKTMAVNWGIQCEEKLKEAEPDYFFERVMDVRNLL